MGANESAHVGDVVDVVPDYIGDFFRRQNHGHLRNKSKPITEFGNLGYKPLTPLVL
jgi:hypothetical protein